MMDLKASPHRRYNPLTREWVLVSPHRTARPWQGQTEPIAAAVQPDYDPSCYLCPGNERAGGKRNPSYTSTFVFENDFAALLADTPEGSLDDHGLLVARSERGNSRVVCFSPHHSLTLARMSVEEISPVIETWREQYLELLSRPYIRYVQIFENRGAMVGASNPHPHGQIWANESLPNEIVKEQSSQGEYRAARGTCLLCDYLALELQRGERIVCENDSFVVLVPFWAVWPFETMLLPKRHLSGMDELAPAAVPDLARMLKEIGARYDNLFAAPFPYSLGFHQRPAGDSSGQWHLHAHYYPPLLRSATVRKFMVGYELLAMPQRDITAESAAERLRACLSGG
jgi:UDPglucose--hexose-1-phosphate uridylyltransferase